MISRKLLLKLGVFLILALFLLAVGGIFFPVPPPHVYLPGDKLFWVAGFPITNTFISSWLTIIVLSLLFFLGTRRMRIVPRGLQNICELIVETIIGFCESVAGKDYGRKFSIVVGTILLFVLMNAWLSLLPGFKVIGFGEHGVFETAFFGEREGFIVHKPLFRNANTDINVPLSLAIVSFIFVQFWGTRALGARKYLGKFVRIGPMLHGLKEFFKGKVLDGLMGLFIGFIQIFVGALELISEFVRVISFTFRLFGNMTAGATVVLMIAFLIPWLVPVPFYGLEMILGFVQALIFGGLTLVFAATAITPHEEH